MKIQQSIVIAVSAILTSAVLANDHNELEEVVVTASPHQKSAQEIAGSFNLIADEELQREAAATLGDTLQNQVGISSSSFGTGVGNPVIRGLSGKRVEILQNSSSVGDASDISPDHAVASEALLAERIEILRGPATLRFGPGAIGGVVNVIDNRIHSTPFEGIAGALETRYSSNGDATAVVGRLDAGFNKFNLHADAVRRDNNVISIPGAAHADEPDAGSEHILENSNAEAESFSTGLSWIGDDWVIGYSFSQLNNNYGLPPESHDHDHDLEGHSEEPESETFVRIDMQQNSHQAKLLFTNLGSIFEQLDIDLGYTDYQHSELELQTGSVDIGSLIESVSHDLRAELTHGDYAGWRGALGFQASNRDFGSSGDEVYIPPSSTQRRGFYWLEETALPLGTLELGARYDQQTISTTTNSIGHDSLNIGGSWMVDLNTGQRISLILSHSERAPAAEELLTNGQHIATNSYEIGDPTLQTETANSVEVSWVFQDNSRFNARVSGYYNRFNRYIYEQDNNLSYSVKLATAGLQGLASCSADLVDFDNSAENLAEAVSCFSYQQRDASFTGIEFESGWSLSDTQRLELQGDLVRGRFNSGSDRDIPRLPPARLRLSWIYESDVWRGDINLTHAMAQTRAGENQQQTAGYNRVDASLSYQLDSVSVILKGQNLFDQTIRNATSFLRDIAPEAGRNLTLAVRYQF